MSLEKKRVQSEREETIMLDLLREQKYIRT